MSIRRTLASVLRQSYQNFELIVVDDGSADSGAQVVKQIAKQDCRIRLIQQSNRGVSTARNVGIREARCELVALIDGDDEWHPNCLQELVQMTEDFPLAALWGVNYADKIGDEIHPYNQGLPDDFRGYVSDYFATPHGDLFCASSVALRKDIAVKVGLFDERIRYAEDLDFWYRMILEAPICFYNHVLAYYNKDAENRVEQDINAHFDIHYRMEYYIDKFSKVMQVNPSFARYYGMRVVGDILRLGYYFGDEKDRAATNHIIKYLPYKVLPYKYGLIFKSPRWIGKPLYQLSLLIKRLKNR